MKKIRCAVYTRKSSEEGLEQDFNSLDAQREACGAYVLSQASEGWSLLPEQYDDGGISGGKLERPALQRLLTDIAAGKIDIVVVYKVDRLTRSLLDFSKLVEAFDKAGTSFVSVTQSFNTTTSMGRLTLNMLLSFAQFEREVTAERIRDKIAASKAKGMWMGGTPPLGYEPDGRSLAVVEDHASIVSDIFQRYLALGNVRLVVERLEREGIRSPVRFRRSGAAYGGCRFTRGQIHHILTSTVYTGMIAHKGKLYPGQHPAIIDPETWDCAQAKLADHVRGARWTRQASPSLLAGKLVDANGEPLVAAHARKRNTAYRYYVSRSLQRGTRDAASGERGLRIPAREIEALVADEVAKLFADPIALLARIGANIEPHCLHEAQTICSRMGSDPQHLMSAVSQIRVLADRVEIDIKHAAVAKSLGVQVEDGDALVMLVSPARLTRTGRVVRLVHNGGRVATPIPIDDKLLRLIIRARHWWSMLLEGELTITELAAREGVTSSYMTRVVRLVFLAPAVVDAILTSATKAGLDAATLTATAAVPGEWKAQAQQYLPASSAI